MTNKSGALVGAQGRVRVLDGRMCPLAGATGWGPSAIRGRADRAKTSATRSPPTPPNPTRESLPAKSSASGPESDPERFQTMGSAFGPWGNEKFLRAPVPQRVPHRVPQRVPQGLGEIGRYVP